MIGSCATIPQGVVAVTSFSLEKYLGMWYEIARLDFAFERDLNNTTARYSLNEDGSVKFDYRGFNYKTNQWQQALGRMRRCSKYLFSALFMPAPRKYCLYTVKEPNLYSIFNPMIWSAMTARFHEAPRS